MKHVLFIILMVLFATACKKDQPQIDPSVPLGERIPGKWDITEVHYNGAFPFNNSWLPFSGEGQNVTGNFEFTDTPNVGAFDVSFIANIDIGVGQPITYPVSQSHDGNWEIVNANSGIRMWRNDTAYVWDVINNTETKQTWVTKFVFDFGGNLDSIPVDVEATMVR